MGEVTYPHGASIYERVTHDDGAKFSGFVFHKARIFLMDKAVKLDPASGRKLIKIKVIGDQEWSTAKIGWVDLAKTSFSLN